MKKIIAILISMLLFVSTSVFANETFPEELMQYPENFTAVYSISLSIDDNSDIRNLIEELAYADENMGSLIGAEFLNFLSAMFDYDGTIDVQADVSSDYKKIKLSLTNSNILSSVVSSNLNYTVKSKGGLWADIDLTNVAAPKIDVTFLSPTSDKYHYFNAGKYITAEDLESFMEAFDVNEFQSLQNEFMQLLYNSSTIEKTRTGYKLSMDNEGFAMYVGSVAAYSFSGEEGFDEETLAMFKDLQFLGKDGITALYTIKNGKISHADVKTEISINLSQIAKAMGEEWPYSASGNINIKLKEKVDFTKIGTTVIKFPKLTEENSVSLNKLIEDSMPSAEPYDDYVFDYPYGYVSASSNALPVIDGAYYVPLRSILEDGYNDSVTIDYDNGVITATSEYFDGFKTLKMAVGDNKVYLDDTERTLETVLLLDGVTYVSTRLFTEGFGWELSDINHDILNNSFTVSFWTY